VNGLGWVGIARLGLVQAALGSIAMLTTSTLNRVMVVELGLAAMVPGLLVGLHYAVQIGRPLWGHGSDRGGRRTPWIIGGVGLLAVAATGAAAATAMMAANLAAGLVLATISYLLIGVGIGAAGTSLLALLAAGAAPQRRPAAATVVWLMMIFGIALTAILSGRLLEPFSMRRLVEVAAGTGLAAFLLTALAVAGVESSILRRGRAFAEPPTPAAPFRVSLAEAWADPQARLFTIFVFVSMLAYSMQDLILEPFAGLVFAMTPGATTGLSGIQNGGVFAGMVMAGLAGSLLARRLPAIVAIFMIAGCLLSAFALAGLASSAAAPSSWPLAANIFALGFANGCFAVAAIASMMSLAGAAGKDRVGLRMGLWGAAQAIGFGLGGFAGTVAVDLLRALGATVPFAYGGVFLLEGLIFVVAAAIALRVKAPAPAAQDAVAPADLQPAE